MADSHIRCIDLREAVERCKPIPSKQAYAGARRYRAAVPVFPPALNHRRGTVS